MRTGPQGHAAAFPFSLFVSPAFPFSLEENEKESEREAGREREREKKTNEK